MQLLIQTNKEGNKMNKIFDDFDDLEDQSFIEGDNFEDHLDDELGNLEDSEEVTEPDDEPMDDSEKEEEGDAEDEFTAKDAFIVGGAMGFAYEEGLRKRKRRKQKIPRDEIT
jgi:hypothetical protein